MLIYLLKKKMTLKRHHKIMIGSLSSLFIIALIANSVCLYFLFVKVNVEYSELSSKITELQTNTQSKMSELTDSLTTTKESLETQLSELKSSTSSDFSGIIEDVIPAVVTIKTDVAQGTGFIIDSEGYIVTNAHVLSGGHQVWAITSDQRTIEGSLIGYDETLDVALLKISGTYDYLSLDDSNNIQVGEKVIAIGNPLGLQFSVSEGIVSAVHRAGVNNLDIYIQTDAALNPGNSGGPLINKKGKVIGINNFKVGSSESLGFALESNYLKESINQIAQTVLNQTLI
jgi:S1-C subfamily serine protease